MSNPPQGSLASQYQEAKSGRKILTSSFKIKSKPANFNSTRDDPSTKSGRPITASVNLQFADDQTKQKLNLNLAKEYHAARRSHTASRAVRDKENIQKETRTPSKDAPTGPKLDVRKEKARTVRGSSRTASRPMRNKETNRQDKYKPESKVRLKETNKETARGLLECDDEIAFQTAPEMSRVQTVHTAKSGYEMLGIRRLDDKKYEVGMADGIQMHLIENIKLCGLRKGESLVFGVVKLLVIATRDINHILFLVTAAREKSITEMIATLCGHLESRESELQQWIEFADIVATAAAEKLSISKLENDTALAMIDRSRSDTKALKLGLSTVHQETLVLKDELNTTKDYIVAILDEFKESLHENQSTLMEECSNQLAKVRSECISDMNKALEDEKAKHNSEKLGLASQITTLREAMTKLSNQLNTASIAASDAKHKLIVTKNEFDVERQALNSKLTETNEEVRRLQDLLDIEKASKQNEIKKLEQEMNQEFEAIEAKVKHSMKMLVESKNLEISKALARAKDAEQVLSELRATVLVSTAEDSGEK